MPKAIFFLWDRNMVDSAQVIKRFLVVVFFE